MNILFGRSPSTEGFFPRILWTETLYSGTTGGMVVTRTNAGSRSRTSLWFKRIPSGLIREYFPGVVGRVRGVVEGGKAYASVEGSAGAGRGLRERLGG